MTDDIAPLAARVALADGLESQMAPVRVRVLKPIPPLRSEGLTGEFREGDVITVLRWQAYALMSEGYVELMDEGFDTELFKAYVRERGLGQGQVSSLPFEDFYSRLRDRLNSLRSKGEAAQQQYRKVYMTAMDLITLRMGKILNAVAGGESAALLMDRIVPEERELLRQIIPLVSDWKKRVLGENP
jgi:hypothetical protein